MINHAASVAGHACGAAANSAPFARPRRDSHDSDAMPVQLDTYDRRLLALLQEDAGRTAEELASRVPLSVSAIQRRIKRLREERVIQRDVAVVDGDAVGGITTFFATLRLGREHPGVQQRLREWLCARPEVQQAYYVTGESDVMLVVCAPDVPAYEAVMRELMASHPEVVRYTTSVVLSPLKRGLAVPVG
jgi:DNA-binding Lrp family transcriptional regulator